MKGAQRPDNSYELVVYQTNHTTTATIKTIFVDAVFASSFLRVHTARAFVLRPFLFFFSSLFFSIHDVCLYTQARIPCARMPVLKQKRISSVYHTHNIIISPMSHILIAHYAFISFNFRWFVFFLFYFHLKFLYFYSHSIRSIP